MILWTIFWFNNALFQVKVPVVAMHTMIRFLHAVAEIFGPKKLWITLKGDAGAFTAVLVPVSEQLITFTESFSVSTVVSKKNFAAVVRRADTFADRLLEEVSVFALSLDALTLAILLVKDEAFFASEGCAFALAGIHAPVCAAAAH